MTAVVYCMLYCTNFQKEHLFLLNELLHTELFRYILYPRERKQYICLKCMNLFGGDLDVRFFFVNVIL